VKGVVSFIVRVVQRIATKNLSQKINMTKYKKNKGWR